MDWQQQALGIAVVDQTPAGGLAVEHVGCDQSGAALTGAWLLDDPTSDQLTAMLSHWVVVGTRDGIQRSSKVLDRDLPSADLRSLVAACQAAEEVIMAAWQQYKDEAPKKRANLVPPNYPSWPEVNEDHDAAQILESLGRPAAPPGTPSEMRDVLALSRLVQYVVNAWQELESERMSRAYLVDLDPTWAVLPRQWAEQNPPFWP